MDVLSRSRKGNRAWCSALYMPAVVATRHNPVFWTFSERLHANGLPKKVVIGAIMRKLVHLTYTVVRSGADFEPNYHERPERNATSGGLTLSYSLWLG